MNVTIVPVHMVLPGFALIATVGATADVTTIVIPVDVAVAGLAQVALLVNTTVITSPFTNALFE